jgi:hypothetical protein
MDDSSPMASKVEVDGGELSQLHDGGRVLGAPARAARHGQAPPLSRDPDPPRLRRLRPSRRRCLDPRRR